MGNAGRPIEADYIASCRYRPQVEVDEAMWGIKLDWYRDWITNTDRDSEYWSQGLWRKLRETPSEMKIPVFIRMDGTTTIWAARLQPTGRCRLNPEPIPPSSSAPGTTATAAR